MKTLRDISLVFGRSLHQTVRNPVWVVIGIMQPFFFLILFGPLLEKVTGGGADAWNVFVPGLLVQLALLGAAFVGFTLIDELRSGVIERLQVTPISRAAMLLGRVLRDIVVLTVQALLLIAIAVPFGLDLGAGAMLMTFLLVALIGASFSALSYWLALVLRSEDTLAPIINFFSLPLLLLSGILLPMTFAPGWLQGVADANPLAYAVDAARATFNGDAFTGTVLTAFVIMGAFAALTITLGVRRFGRNSERVT